MNRSVWITGASSGLGRALALKMAQEGWTVGASARNEEALQDLVEEAREHHGSIRAFPLDVTDTAAVATCWGAVEQAIGPVQQVVLNAGSHRPVKPDSFSRADFEALISLNVMGTVSCLEQVLKTMLARGSGRIAIVASLAGYRGLPTAAAYGLTKAGLINMTESLHPELRQKGIFIQIVNPGFVETPLTDKNDFSMPFLMKADDAAAAFYHGLLSNRFEIVFPWRFAFLMKLYRCLPQRLALWLAGRMVES